MEMKSVDKGGYILHMIKTDRFKTISFNASLRIPDKKEYSKYIPLLSKILLTTNSKYNSIKQINRACMNLYDPSYNIRTLRSGKAIILELTSKFINEKYTEKNMNEKSIKFVLDFLFNPKVISSSFDEESFLSEKSKTIDYYSSLKDYPREYAESRLYDEMKTREYKDYTISELTQEIKKISSNELYKFYREIIDNGTLDIFVCGDFDFDEMENTISNCIKYNGEKKILNHLITQEEYNIKPNIVIDKSLNVQSSLVIGCKMIDINKFERDYVSVLYSWILGGGMNSLLNQTVREKNSLCYYIYAMKSDLLGTIKINAGINGSDFDRVMDLINKEMENMKKGKFSEELFLGVKNIYYNSLVSIEDYQDSMLNSYVSKIFIDKDDIETRKKMMEEVTFADVVNFSKKVHMDTVYLLKGEAK